MVVKNISLHRLGSKKADGNSWGILLSEAKWDNFRDNFEIMVVLGEEKTRL